MWQCLATWWKCDAITFFPAEKHESFYQNLAPSGTTDNPHHSGRTLQKLMVFDWKPLVHKTLGREQTDRHYYLENANHSYTSILVTYTVTLAKFSDDSVTICQGTGRRHIKHFGPIQCSTLWIQHHHSSTNVSQTCPLVCQWWWSMACLFGVHNLNNILRDHSGYGLSQSETKLQCNIVSHWLSKYPKGSLILPLPLSCCMPHCFILEILILLV